MRTRSLGVDVGSDVWRPVVNACHDNCEAWCEQHRDHQFVRGWLHFFRNGDGVFPVRVAFGGTTARWEPIDITPTAQLLQADPYPFLPAGVSDDEYAAPEAELYGTTGSGNLCWQYT